MKAGVLALVLVALAGCGPRARRLPSRVVDDPMTPPRRMLDVAVTAAMPARYPEDALRWDPELKAWPAGPGPFFGARVRYGFSDRVTWTFPGLVTVAVLDDAPVEHASTGYCALRAPFALSFTAGFLAFRTAYGGDLFLEGRTEAHLRKRLRPDLRLDWTLGAERWMGAQWGQPWSFDTRVGATWQVAARVAAQIAIHDGLGYRSNQPGLPGFSFESVAVSPGVIWRPRDWITLTAEVDVGGTHRTAIAARPTPEGSTSVPADTWLSIAGRATVRAHY